jgi:hypothetical protein
MGFVLNANLIHRGFVMRYPFKSSFFKAIGMFGLLGLGLSQVGCAHPVSVEPSVVVHSRVGHFPVHAKIGVPGQVIYAPPSRVIYAPPPPPRVVYVPRVYAPVYGWGHGHDGHQRGHDRRHYRQGDGDHGRGGWDRRYDRQHDGRHDGRHDERR